MDENGIPEDARNERLKMAEDTKGKEPSEGAPAIHRHAKVSRLIFPWVLLFVFALTFQAQFVFHQKELAAIKLQLSKLSDAAVEEEKKSLSKRSVGENDKNAVKKVSGMEAVHLRGVFPFQKIEKDGRIGPWSLSSPSNAFVILKAKNTEVEIITKGLYYVYAQIYYLTNQPPNSYQILTYNGTEERKNHRVLSTCACQGRNVIGEVSCYTGFTGMFNKGHRLYLHQIEQNRIINNSNGCSFFGVVLLKKTRDKRREGAGSEMTT